MNTVAERQTERETKYDVDQTYVVPDLTDLLPTGGRVEHSTVNLESVYFDTPAHDLLANGVTLRSRSGDTDTGWQLKVPAAGKNTRTEVRLPATDELPAELLALTSGLRRGADLQRVATLRTRRGLVKLIDDDDVLLAEIADDDVRSAAPSADGALLQEWRELEAEFGESSPRLEKQLDKRLRLSGATPAAGPNKVSRALNGATTGAPPEAGESAGSKKGSKKSATAGEVLLAYVREQDEALIAGDLALRQGESAIHPTRVATRRLRSTLRIFAAYVDADQAAAFDAELSWYADLLGEVRDREVQRGRMAKLISALPDELVLGPVAATVEKELLSEQLHRRAELDAEMTSDRYFALLRESQRWVTEPPFTAAAGKKAKRLAADVGKASEKLAKHLAAGLAGDNDEELHKARKAGKRARYAAELATPVLGDKKAHRMVSRYQKVQDTLGEHQDGVVSGELLKRLALGTVGKRTQNGFTYGLLYAQEMERARESRDKAAKLYAQLLA